MISPARDADIAFERRRVARIDGGAADEEVEIHVAALLPGHRQRPPEAGSRRGHARPDQGQNDAEPELADQGGAEHDARS